MHENDNVNAPGRVDIDRYTSFYRSLSETNIRSRQTVARVVLVTSHSLPAATHVWSLARQRQSQSQALTSTSKMQVRTFAAQRKMARHWPRDMPVIMTKHTVIYIIDCFRQECWIHRVMTQTRIDWSGSNWTWSTYFLDRDDVIDIGNRRSG